MKELAATDYDTCFFKYGFQLTDLYGFKKKHLYNLRTLERLKVSGRGYYIEKKYYTFEELKTLTKEINQTVSLHRLQWWQQCEVING